MPGKLLLPSAKSGVLIEGARKSPSPWWRRIAISIGVLAVLVGLADVTTRVANQLFGDDAAFFTFAPAALLFEPDLWGQVQGTSTTAFVPARISVAAIGVKAEIEPVGKKPDGSMATPSALQRVAWYAPGSRPGSKGNAVFAGHVNNALGLPGVFKELKKLVAGDTVIMESTDGRSLTYVVEEVNRYLTDEAPLEAIFSTSGPSRIILITCEGEWDEETRSFDKRLVITARLL